MDAPKLARAAQLLDDWGLVSGDAYSLPTSPAAFPDGRRFRVEIPSVEAPEALRTVLAEPERRSVTVERASQGSGITLQTNYEIEEMVRLGEGAGVQACLFTGPRVGWDSGVQAASSAGGLVSGALRGSDQVRFAIKEIVRAYNLGLHSVLIADLRLLAVVGRARNRGDLPDDLRVKVSISFPAANAATVSVLEELGTESVNLPVDLPLPSIAAIRQAWAVPIEIYIEAADDFGGCVRYNEIPELVRVASPDLADRLAAEPVRRAAIILTFLDKRVEP